MSSSGRRRYQSASSIGPRCMARSIAETADSSSVGVISLSLRPAIGEKVRSSPSDFATYKRIAAVRICATASSETRKASLLSTSSREARSKSGAMESIQPYRSLRRSASDADIDFSIANDEVGLAQAKARRTLVVAGLDRELVAVPRADDLALALVISLRAHGLVGGDRL